MKSDDVLAALSMDPVAYLDDPDPDLRRLAVAMTAGAAADESVIARLALIASGDSSARVRAEAAEALGKTGSASITILLAAARDTDPIVIEAAATAMGEVGDDDALPWLLDAAAQHPDRLVREAAVASLGAIGNERARPLLLDLVSNGPPQVRRRCIVALTVFDGDDIEAAVRAALTDRNPMVREAAEMVAGRPISDGEHRDPG